ncbi:MAG: hypothetical protein ABW136_02230, partial [Steroidobacteraceae bacterium]
SSAVAGDKEDAERLLQKISSPAPVCYTLNVLRPVNAPAVKEKPGFTPLAGVVHRSSAGLTTSSCSAPGTSIKAASPK